MNKDFSIRIHGRGGQGIKTFASFVAESAIKDGFYAQAFPEFGPERRGAPVIAYVRLSSKKIITRSPIEKPNFIVILDESVMNTKSVREGISEDTLFLINTAKTPQEVKEEYSFFKKDHHIYCIDANDKLLEFEGKVHVNNIMVGRFLKITEVVSLDTVKEVFKDNFLNKIGEEGVENGQRAIESSYFEV